MEEKIELFDFENLKVYQKSLDLVDRVYDLTDTFPSKEIYKLVSQFTRASYSIPMNIGEGSGGSRKEFLQFLSISRRSARECIVCTTISARRKYIDKTTELSLRKDITEITKMLSGLMNYLESDKAKNIMSEPLEPYLRTPNPKLPTNNNG